MVRESGIAVQCRGTITERILPFLTSATRRTRISSNISNPLNFFKRKAQSGGRKDELLTEQFSIAVIDGAEAPHEAKLRREMRVCPTCSYHIVNPMTDRCPRCFSAVPLSEHTNCGDCDYKGNCALAELHGKKG